MHTLPLSIEITNISADHIATKIRFKNRVLEPSFKSGSSGEGLFFLLGVLYYFSPKFVEYRKTQKYTDDLLDLDQGETEIENYIEYFQDLDTDSGDQVTLANRAYFSWFNLQGCSISDFEWDIERELTLDSDFKLKIRCSSYDEDDEMITLIDTEVPFKEFCFNVVKTIDDAIKHYGLTGIDSGVVHQGGEFHLRHFLYLKAYLLDRFDLIEDQPTHGSLEREIELLRLPMK